MTPFAVVRAAWRKRPGAVGFVAFTAVFAVLVAFVFWGTWSPDVAPVMPDSPIVYSPYWFGDWWRAWLASGKFIPWDLHIFLGSPYFWQEINYAVGMYASGLAVAFFLCGRGLSRLAAYGAGLLLSFCGYWCTLFSAGHGGWFFWMTYGLWPFGFVDRGIRGGRVTDWLMLGACLGWAAYWQTDLWLLFTAFVGAYFVYRCLAERKFPWKGMLLAGISLFAIGGAAFRNALVNDLAGRDKQIEAGETLSARDKDEVDAREKRWVFVTNWSLPPAESAEFFIPRLNGDTSCPMTLSLGSRYGTGVKPYTGALGRPKDAPAGNYRQHSLYVGWITCLLAIAGIASAFFAASRDRRVEIAFFAVAAALFWLCSLGRYCEPVYRVVFALPFGDYLRAPVKWHHLTEFCLVVLAGFGLEGILVRLGRLEPVRRFAPWLVGAVVIVGACDLARIAHLYCAPVDLREAKRQSCSLQMTFLPTQTFADPQVAAMVRAKRLVSLAKPNPDVYLVGVLEPWRRNTEPLPPFGMPAALSILSMGASLALFAGWGIVVLRRRSAAVAAERGTVS